MLKVVWFSVRHPLSSPTSSQGARGNLVRRDVLDAYLHTKCKKVKQTNALFKDFQSVKWLEMTWPILMSFAFRHVWKSVISCILIEFRSEHDRSYFDVWRFFLWGICRLAVLYNIHHVNYSSFRFITCLISLAWKHQYSAWINLLAHFMAGMSSQKMVKTITCLNARFTSDKRNVSWSAFMVMMLTTGRFP